MNFNVLFRLLLIVIHCIFYSYAHSASSSSALASTSVKFKNPKLEKEKAVMGRKNKISGDGEDDDSSKFNVVVYFFIVGNLLHC
jgi:hypothetical protein